MHARSVLVRGVKTGCPVPCADSHRSAPPRSAFGEGPEIAYTLNLIVRQFDVEMVFEARQHIEGLQAIDSQLFVEVIFGLQRARGSLEMLGREFKDFLCGLLECAHNP